MAGNYQLASVSRVKVKHILVLEIQTELVCCCLLYTYWQKLLLHKSQDTPEGYSAYTMYSVKRLWVGCCYIWQRSKMT
jgi:hypothetical protein